MTKIAPTLVAVVVTLPVMAACGLLGATKARAEPITFDNLHETGLVITNGYGGFNWNNFFILNTVDAGLNGYTNGTVSPPNIAFNGNGGPACFSAATAFEVESFYLTSAWNNGLHVVIDGYNGSALEDTDSITINTTGPALLTLDWMNITELYFSSYGGISAGYQNGTSGTQFALDNLAVDTTQVRSPPLSRSSPPAWAH